MIFLPIYPIRSLINRPCKDTHKKRKIVNKLYLRVILHTSVSKKKFQQAITNNNLYVTVGCKIVYFLDRSKNFLFICAFKKVLVLHYMKYTHLLFDLDGTLTDSMPGITRSVQYALKHFGIEVEDLAQLRPFIGPPLKDSFREIYRFTQEQATLATAKYHEYFSTKGIFENAVYPRIKDFLQQQKNENRSVLLATSKPEILAKQILDHFELTPYFDFIGGATFDDSRSYKKDVIHYVLETCHLNNRLDECIMIGDRKHDIEGAKANCIASVGVLYGYGSHEELSQAGADYLVNDLTELQTILG